MNVPSKIILQTKGFAENIALVTFYQAQYGPDAINQYLKKFPMRLGKTHGRYASAYIISKVCQEYQIAQYDLFESSGRLELTEARQLLCVLIEKHVSIKQDQISSYFNRSRHFAKRMIGSFKEILKENHPIDKKKIDRYKKLDSLIEAYMAFKPLTK